MVRYFLKQLIKMNRNLSEIHQKFFKTYKKNLQTIIESSVKTEKQTNNQI